MNNPKNPAMMDLPAQQDQLWPERMDREVWSIGWDLLPVNKLVLLLFMYSLFEVI